ncbi:MAG: alpha/beta hydrolase [Alphaproteobacteria bacterium]|nr:alpha/beta hydrolase [Alphaproteobacteria bacterium]
MKWVWRGFALLVVTIAGTFLIFRVPDSDPEAMRAKYGDPPSQFVQLGDGRSVHLRDEGPRDAPVIVLLHGSNADLHTWQPWAEDLRGDYRVIRYDQRGHGLTGPAPDGDYRREAFVADVERVAEALGLERFVLGGNSMGGAVAMGYAIAHPERLGGLVLVDASGVPMAHRSEDSGDDEGGGGNLLFTLARLPGINALVASVTPRAMIEQSLSQSVSNQAVVTPEAVDRYWELLRYPGNRTATLDRFAIPREEYARADVARVAVPTLVMWGEEDALIPFSAAGWYADALPAAELVHYPGIGHLPMEEAPERSVADLRAFLARLPLGGTAQTVAAGGAARLSGTC